MALRTVGPVGYQNQKTYNAETAVSRGHGVKAGASDGGAAALVTAGGRGIGIASEDAVVGGPLAVTRHGDAVAIAGAAATAGQYAKFDANGRVIASAGAPGSGEEIVGRFESSPTQAGDECVVFVNPFIL